VVPPTYPEPVPSAPFLVPPLLLIVVLTVSAVAKVRDPRDTRTVMRQLELPDLLLRLQAPRLLPWGELAVAAMLLLLPGAGYVAATTLSLVLFVCYLAVVARALTFDHPLVCGCFGSLGLGWITRQTLVRNAVLVALAVVAWVDSWRGDGVLSRLGDLERDGWWWLVGVLVTLVLTGLVVRESRPPQADLSTLVDDEDYVATPVPYALLDGPDGPSTTWRLTDAAARLLVFWDPRQDDAGTLVARLPSWRAALAPVEVHLVSSTEWSTVRDLRPELAEHLLGDPDGDTRLRLRVYSVPGAVLLGADRLLAGGPVEGLARIEELVEAAADELRSTPMQDGAPAQ
jgi:hypothetical protein